MCALKQSTTPLPTHRKPPFGDSRTCNSTLISICAKYINWRGPQGISCCVTTAQDTVSFCSSVKYSSFADNRGRCLDSFVYLSIGEHTRLQRTKPETDRVSHRDSHVFGQTAKKEHGYENVKVSGSAWDTNLVSASGVNTLPLHVRPFLIYLPSDTSA